ncbi:MAG: trypsin-like peptidase domain-containing protein [Patescibacteria group bacterium]
MEATSASRHFRVFGLLVLNVIVAVSVHLAWSSLARPAGAAAVKTPAGSLSEEDRIIKLVSTASPAVVSILVQQRGQQEALIEIGKGTGFLIDADGLVITNRHVAFERDAVLTALLTDGRSFSAKVIDIDPVNDLALLKIDAKGLPFLALEADDRLRLGQTTVAIGNALGKYANTVTSGILSGVGRDVEAANNVTGDLERLEELLQTDAAINGGNSGGPLLNLDGKVIGVNTAVEQDAQGLGFAIPVSEVRKVLTSYRRYGAIARPRLGVRYFTITPELKIERSLAYGYGALVGGEDPSDAVVLPNSPAAAAGLLEGDVILEVNGKKLEGKWTLAKAVQSLSVGDVARLKIARAGTTIELRATLDAHPPYGRRP